MGFIEKISPKWAYKREAWRQANEIQKRNYDAGMYDRQNRNWFAHNESGEQTDKYFRGTVRARSRDLERNSDLMNANIHPWVRNVVGKGYTLEAKTDDEEFNDNIEKLWVKWCKKDNCDVTGSQSFWEMARMAIRRKRVDGGILFIKCYTRGGIVPFKLQALEVDELDEVQSKPNYEGNKVVGGIEYNSYNKAVGYWIKEYDIEGYLKSVSRFKVLRIGTPPKCCCNRRGKCLYLYYTNQQTRYNTPLRTLCRATKGVLVWISRAGPIRRMCRS